MSKILVAYFSASGVTERVARQLADVTGGTLYGKLLNGASKKDIEIWTGVNR